MASSDRHGRGDNRETVIFVRGAQPIIVDNVFRNNTYHDNTHTPNWKPVGTHLISINANALNSAVQGDYGRSTGLVGLVTDEASEAPAFTDNRGPLIRRNLVANNDISGMEVRGEELTTETVWDDTDIVHVLRDEIVVLNHHTFSGLRLQSNPGESLVVKLSRPSGGANLAANADFELGNVGFTSNYSYGIADPPEGSYLIARDPNDGPFAASVPRFGDHTSGNGQMLVFNGVDEQSVWQQSIAVTPGTDYDFSVWIASIDATSAAQLQVFVNGRSIGSQDMPAVEGLWREFKATWNSGSSSNADIRIVDNNAAVDGNDFALDDIYFGRAAVGLAGLTANGTPLDIDDRIGGTVQILGLPDFPVVLTSLADDTGGASLGVDGLLQRDTNNDGNASKPAAGDWRGILLETYSNDRNVLVVNETESSFTNANDRNGTPADAQLLGELAKNEKSGDENLALGFTVNGFIAVDDPTDVDVYSFKVPVGTEVWIDIDRTRSSLDAVVELVAQNGSLLARSIDNQTLESTPSVTARSLIRDDRLGGDFYSTNPRDPGMRVVLPGTGTGQGTYYVRIRSNTAPGRITDVKAGLTRGEYQLQIRLRQLDEVGGSNVRYANLLYPQTGIHVRGLPAHSPLTGETAEDTTVDNNARTNAQNIGNLLATDRNVISVAGRLSAATDIDWYRVELTYDQIQAISGVNNAARSFAAIFDLDYADQLGRPDAVLSIYDESGALILTARDSDILDDQPLAGEGNDIDDLTRGSLGPLDPYIGTVQLPAEVPGQTEVYYVAVSSNLRLPGPLNQTFAVDTATPLVRLEPINSVQRVVEDHLGSVGYVSGDTLVGTQLAGPRAILPDTPALFDLTNLGNHVLPWDLEDVTLFVSTGNAVEAFNPFDGSPLYNLRTGFASQVTDLDMRTDGRLFVYRYDNTTNTNDSGIVEQVDVGSGTSTAGDGMGNNSNTAGAFAFGGRGRHTTRSISIPFLSCMGLV